MTRSFFALLFSILIVSLPELSNAQSGRVSYSTEPLQIDVMPPSALEEAALDFVDELYENYHQIPPQSMAPLREYLYMMINAKVKHIYDESGSILKKGAPLLEALFFWAEPLGVIGGAHVFNEIKSDEHPDFDTHHEIPENIKLQVENDAITVTSDHGWAASIPYYFMITLIDDFESVLGERTQAFVFSTGTSPDGTQAGYSQGTITLLYVDSPSSPDFKQQWGELLNMGDDTEALETGYKSTTSVYSFDEDIQIHTEIVDLSSENYGMLVVYSGYEATWQHNRIHFTDFLHHLRMP
ncbi:MAG: hypothetical protein LAT84_06895 [Balneolia bacterium]|nr:hypothetical protein [Balneolia bacterium]